MQQWTKIKTLNLSKNFLKTSEIILLHGLYCTLFIALYFSVYFVLLFDLSRNQSFGAERLRFSLNLPLGLDHNSQSQRHVKMESRDHSSAPKPADVHVANQSITQESWIHQEESLISSRH